MSEPTVVPTITWETTPEDPEVQWSRDTIADDLYAWVSVDGTVLVADSFDYPHPTRHETWNWAVESVHGHTVNSGTAKSECDAKTDAEKALASAREA